MMEALEVWQRLQRTCIHRESEDCNDSGSMTQICAFVDCPFLNESYDWKKFIDNRHDEIEPDEVE